MIKWLIIHPIKEASRSILRYRNLAANILFGFLFLLLILNFLSIGLMIDRIFAEVAPDKDPIELMNSFILYYFAFELFIRFILQGLPSLSVKPYLHLPIRRKVIVHFLLTKSVISIFNLLPLLVIIPFAVKVVVINYAAVHAIFWIAAIVSLSLLNNFLNFYFKKQMTANPIRFFIYVIALCAILSLDIFSIISITKISSAIFGYLLQQPLLIFLFFGAILAIYLINFRFLISHTYIDELRMKKQESKLTASGFTFLQKHGEIGEFLSLELKLLLRNKRPRTSIYFAFFILLIGLYFYKVMPLENNFYPKPKPESYSTPASINNNNLLKANDKLVNLKVFAKKLPPDVHIYVTGNHEKLANWKTARKPLELQQDSSWIRTMAFNPGTEIEYKLTLGTWDCQRLEDDGHVPVNYKLKVENDTTIIHYANNWAIPKRHWIIDFNLVYIGLMLTGMLMLIYGQFMLSWESSYFDAILSRKIDFENYFLAKYILLIVFGLAFYLLTLPYGFYSRTIIYINSALALYNIGVNSIVLFVLSTYARKHLDLNASLFGTQGKGASQYLALLPTLILPILIFLLFRAFGFENAGFIFLAVLGLAGIIFHKTLIRLIIKIFYNQKYKIAAGFRQG